MTIRKICLTDDTEVEQLWYLQQLSYRIEAEWNGLQAIPPLMDTIETIRNCGEIFYADFEQEEMIGAVSYMKDRESVTVCRLMVHPEHLRKGVGGRLLQLVEEAEPGISMFKVVTGSKNLPAIGLYTKHGYSAGGRKEAPAGIKLTAFIKNK
ncbi:GNAT family N-acetyltransferase [Ferviditalea candida]|uniref:GNAT family N-acetyltransferase n=1 Tax=Ferviditalea candida TaxID=3108399 RepID=A0ABU5ZLG6_9BACL|nr:GNAT family N-acetyltransferase [Paenibacillaceae bacterium T2]